MIEFINNQAIAGQEGAKVFITGDICENTVIELQKDIELCRNAEVKHITFCINSPGGSVSDGMALYDIVAALSDIETTAEIQGLCASAATYLPLACDKITITANSDMMLHEPEGGFYGTVVTATADLEYFNVLRDRIIAIYCARTGLTPDEIVEILKAAKFLNAKKCKELNLVDEIIGEEEEKEEATEEKEEEKPEEELKEEKLEDEKPTNFFSLKNLISILKENNISFLKAENDEFADQTEVVNSLTNKIKDLETELAAKDKSYNEIVNQLEETKADIEKKIQLAVTNKIAGMGYRDELPMPEKAKKMTDSEFANALKEIYRREGYAAAEKFTNSREAGEI